LVDGQEREYNQTVVAVCKKRFVYSRKARRRAAGMLLQYTGGSNRWGRGRFVYYSNGGEARGSGRMTFPARLPNEELKDLDALARLSGSRGARPLVTRR